MQEEILLIIKELGNKLILQIALVVITGFLKPIINRKMILGYGNQKIIDKIILSTNKNNIKHIFFPFFNYCYDILSFFIAIFFIGFVFFIEALFVNIRFNKIDFNRSFLMIFSMILITLLLAYYIGKINKYSRIKPIIFVWITSLYIILYICLQTKSSDIILYTCIFTSVLWDYLLNCVLNIIFYHILYESTYIKISETIRYILILISVFLAIKLKVIYVSYIYCIYIFMAFCENIFIILKMKSDVFEPVIYTSKDVVDIKSAIAKCTDGQIIYNTIDNKYKFINADDIMFISYKFRYAIKINNKKRVICYLKSGKIKQYNYYKCINQEWLAFYMYDGSYRIIDIYNLNKIDALLYL